jgi:hypothetical protein
MQVRGAKTVRWMPSDGHSPYVGENGNWWQWNDKLQRYVDTGVSAKGVQGMPGQIPFQKEWKAGDTHRNDTNIVDYIYVRSADPNSRKWYKLKDTYVIRTVPSDETEPSADTLSTYYEEIPWMSELAINVLLVEEGNIANFIFKDGKLISVRGTVDGVEADYAGQANFVPNIVLDGKGGEVSITGKFETNKKGDRIIIDPASKELKFINSKNESLGIMGFFEDTLNGISHYNPYIRFMAPSQLGVLYSRITPTLVYLKYEAHGGYSTIISIDAFNRTVLFRYSDGYETWNELSINLLDENGSLNININGLPGQEGSQPKQLTVDSNGFLKLV